MSVQPRSHPDESPESLRSRLQDYERRFRFLDDQMRVLERERQKLSAVVNHTDAGFLVVNDSLEVIWANNIFAARFGGTTHAGSILGAACNRVLCRRDRICDTCPAAQPFKSGKVAHHEMRLEVHGQPRYIYTTAMPIKSLTGTTEQTIVMLQDVSDLEVLRRSREALVQDIAERKRTEEALRLSEAQLRQSQKMEAVGRLAGGVAHDFNNLLTVITGRSQLLLRRVGADAALRQEIEVIRSAAERAASLTRQLLAFSRKQVLQPKILDLNAVVADMGKILRRLIGEDIELVTVLAPGLGSVKADQGQIEQVIMNLAVNARDAMPGGGRLTIETREVDRPEAPEPAGRGRCVMLALSDTGCGMDAETVSHVFEPFFTTKEQGTGTGLGLSTSYGIVRQSGGLIRVESTPGRGATFRIYLPITEGGPRAVAAETGEEAAQSFALRGTETVLLVEDEEVVRELAREVLEMNGYTVLETRDVEDAQRICSRHGGAIHLMLTDVVMPRMSGRELAERLAPLRPEMRVLYMSGYTDDAIVLRGVLESGTAFLQKPFTPDDLAAKVREVLDGSRAA